jgi:hypothetical protein
MALPQTGRHDAKRSIILLCDARPSEISERLVRKATDNAVNGIADSLRRTIRHANTNRQRRSHDYRQCFHIFANCKL